jgi:hypothetical protein
MTFSLPSLKFVPSPNYSSRNGARISKIVVHMTEGVYAGAVAWFARKASQVSAHLVMKADGSEVAQCVALGDKAWHVCNFNPTTIGIEGEGFTAKGFDETWAKTMGRIVAWLLKRYGLPCRWAEGGVGDGFCSHHDLGSAGGNHDDPTAIGSAAWAHLVQLIQAAYAELGDGELPVWALHGLPAPMAISPPPALAEGETATSHGGQAGAEAGEAAHPAPVGSTLWAQERLVQLGVNSTLECDGLAGPQTRAAVAKFQSGRGLYVDGVIGAKAIAALEAA